MKEILRITRALSDENRIRALMMLRSGEMCVCRIIEMLNLAPSTVSKHMSILKQADLVETRRAGKWTYYRRNGEDIDSPAGKIFRWLDGNLNDDPKIIRDRSDLVAKRKKWEEEKHYSSACCECSNKKAKGNE